MASPPWPGPRRSVESLSARHGRDAVVAACIDSCQGARWTGTSFTRSAVHRHGGPLMAPSPDLTIGYAFGRYVGFVALGRRGYHTSGRCAYRRGVAGTGDGREGRAKAHDRRCPRCAPTSHGRPCRARSQHREPGCRAAHWEPQIAPSVTSSFATARPTHTSSDTRRQTAPCRPVSRTSCDTRRQTARGGTLPARCGCPCLYSASSGVSQF